VSIASKPTEWLQFLARASQCVSAAGDPAAIAEAVAQLAVPALADWCDLFLSDDDGLLVRAASVGGASGRAPPTAPADGKARLIRDVTDPALAARSMMLLPLVAGPHTLGLLALGSVEAGRGYGDDELALAQELAARTALAVAHARLFAAEKRARAEAEVARLAHADSERRLAAIRSTDVAERDHAEEALRRSQERFEKVFRASTLAICVTSVADGTLVDANAALQTLTGYSLAEMRGRTGDELNLWVQTGGDRTAMFEALRTVGSVRNLEVQMRDRAGCIHDTIMSLELIDLEGQSCILSLVHEVTELKRLNDRLLRAQKMEALGRLAGGIAHDFNNILTAISGYTGLVLEALPCDSPVHASAVHIARAAARAAGLTHQLLVFGRQRVQEPEVIDLNGAVRNLLAMLRRLIDEDVSFETSFDADAGAVEIDPAQLEQVILNLTLNARDAMPKGGRLRISTGCTRREDGSAAARLTVEDDGVGMDEATRLRIFEPFFTTKDVGSGTGLGLATVYGIVEQAGGQIVVESAPDRGARFDVILPRSARAPAVAPLRTEALVSVGANQTLLVVEDDESVCEFVSLVLRSAGYGILTARDGDEAVGVAALHPGKIDLLLTDIVMPNRNGRALANELRRVQPGLRVMYMSGYPGDTLQRYEGIPSGDAFLQKPFTREVLFEKVADALRLRR
jgi:PAS domain S-box-containing protein